MNKFLLLVFLLISTRTFVSAQNFQYGDHPEEELSLKKYAKDTSAHAVVLNEYGITRINVYSDDNIKILHEYHIKIKLFDSKAFDKGTVEIPIYTGGETNEIIEDITGLTTYTDDNGQAQRSTLDASKIFTVKENKYWSNVKFTMPNLRSGCIIEYKYSLVSPYWDKFPSWRFQSDIPKVNSEYEVHIPAFWTYNAMLRGNIPLTKNTSKVEQACFTTHGSSCDCSHIVFGMANVPAFIEEDYMTSSKNFISAAYFQLSEYINPYTGTKVKVTKDWKDIDYNLKHAGYFGAQLRRKELLKQYISPVIIGKTDELAKARAIYAYIQKNIRWSGLRSRGSEDGVRKALINHTGNAGDVNLTLVTALSAAGIDAEAVLISTRDNGLVSRLYPVEDEFDYVIAKLNIGSNTYLLDATDPLLSFGMLPLKCLNDQGRVMSLDKPSYWINLVAEEKKASTTALNLTLLPDGKLKGSISIYSKGYEAYEKRKAIKKFNSLDEYVENLDERLTKIKILKSDIVNTDSLDMPLIEKYDIETDGSSFDHARVSFNPVIMNRITANPFKLEDRNYPVDWGMPSDDHFILNLHLPDNYAVESLPAANSLGLPAQGGRFLSDCSINGNEVIFSNVITFNKSVYTPDEYPYLKEFYNKIIAAEKVEIIFKKK